jgi:hypothetical protein
MRIEARTENERIDFFQGLYEDAKGQMSAYYEALDRHMAQYRGSKDIDGSDEQASVVRNITYELVESQVSSYIPTPNVASKVVSEKNTRLAKSIETLCKDKRNELPFEKMNDLDERYNPVYGGSVWLIEWDESLKSARTAGDIRVTCLPPKSFVGEPNIYDNINDMDYCFISFETTKADLVRKYGVSYEVADDTTSDKGADDNSATVYVCYYKDEDDKICQFIWSGDRVLVDVGDYFGRKMKICKTCGKREELCTCKEDGNKQKLETVDDEYEIPDAPIPLSDGTVIPVMSNVIEDGQPVIETVSREALDQNGQMIFESVGGVMLPKTVQVQMPKMEETKIPWYRPKSFPIVIRKNTSIEESLFGQSDCEFIRPQQQAINKIESRIMQKLMKAYVTPVVPEDASVTIRNEIFGQLIKLKPGQSAHQYGTIDTTPSIAQDIAQSDRIYDHAKRILGISDSYMGQADSTAQSGKAKQLQIQQAAGRLESKRQMKNAAYAEMDRIIFELYLAFADEPRDYAYKDSFGRMQNITFRRHDFIERDEAGNYYYNDQFLFSADASVDAEKSREFIWQENLKNFQLGAFGDPATPEAQLIYWQNNESARYPFAHDNVERIKENIKMQQQIAAQQQMLAQMGAENQALAQEAATAKSYGDYLYNGIQGGGF